MQKYRRSILLLWKLKVEPVLITHSPVVPNLRVGPLLRVGEKRRNKFCPAKKLFLLMFVVLVLQYFYRHL